MRSSTRGLGKPFVVLVLALLVAGCGGGSGETTVAAQCNDAAFRAQDEELYVTKAAVSNAGSGGGEPAAQLLDLKRARRALAGYLAAHPPCAEDLLSLAATEQTALDEIDAAIVALESTEDAGPHLANALASLQAAQNALLAGQ
jgi:hypothetical protein